MSESRRPIHDDELRQFFTAQLERMPRTLRTYIAQGKRGTEHFMAFEVVRALRKRGWRLDAPDRGSEGGIGGLAMPPKDPDGS